MRYDASLYSYPSQRTVVHGRRGMVAASQPLAAQAGLDMLKAGGNAVDAAIATAACLTVVEPTSNGIGGDAFALLFVDGQLHGLNASGPAPQRISIQELGKNGYNEIPDYGWIPVTVPGAPGGWAALSGRFGKLPLAKVLQPAVEYAEQGYPVSPIAGSYWEREFNTFQKKLKGEEFSYWFQTFAQQGRAPRIGETWRSQDMAETLRSIAETRSESFYRGDLADKIDRFSRKYGGYLRKDDLEKFKPEWVEPIKVSYRGYDIWELPPNGQGIVVLMALNILKEFEFKEKESVDTYHRQIEAMKIALGDGQGQITDPKYMKTSVEELLSDNYAEEKRKTIKNEAVLPTTKKINQGGTVYLSTADENGNMVSYVQSNYRGFGSGLVVPGTGISLQNRGKNFTMNPTHVNCLEPGKRPYHTIIAGFITKDDECLGPFGVMGGFMQAQGHLQIIMNAIDFGQNPQSALDAPRWQWLEGKEVAVEPTFSKDMAGLLESRGHSIIYETEYGGYGQAFFGRGQIIWRNKYGNMAGATDPRTDGQVAVW